MATNSNSGKRLVLTCWLDHDQVRYEPGSFWDEILPEEKMVWDQKARETKMVPMTEAEQAKLTASLLANGTLKREDEIDPANVISAQDQEIARLNAELEELKAKLGVPERLGDGGGAQGPAPSVPASPRGGRGK